MSRGDGDRGLSLDGPFLHVLEVIMYLWMLNLVTIICSLPIITAGAAMTAMHHQLYLIFKGEEGYVLRGYFHDFKSNFKQATKAWLIMLPVGVVLGVDLILFAQGADFSPWYKFGIFGITVLYLFVFVYLFPILARYSTTLQLAFKNALFMAIFGAVKTLLMVILVIAPWVLLYLVENIFIFVLLFGITVPAFANVALYRKTFEAFEKNQANAQAKAMEGDPLAEEALEETTSEEMSGSDNKY